MKSDQVNHVRPNHNSHPAGARRTLSLGAVLLGLCFFVLASSYQYGYSAEPMGAKKKEFSALQARTKALGKTADQAAWSQLLSDVRAWAQKYNAPITEHSQAATASAATSSGGLSPCEPRIRKKVGRKTVDCWLVPNKSTSTTCFYICTGL